jgi:hypothetical protein
MTLDGMHDGPVTAFTHPRGWFSLDLPVGWSVARHAEDGLVVNPGLTQADTLDALITISFGALEPELTQMDVLEVFQRLRPAVLQDLKSQGIEMLDEGTAPRRVTLAHAPGLVQQWMGQGGGRQLLVWLGGLLESGHYVAVTAVVLAGEVSRFLPGAKRILYSVHPRPPRRDGAVERALEGAQFFASDTRPGGSFSVILEFAAGNQVKKTMMVSARTGLPGTGGSSEQWGTYEVIGDQARLLFSADSDELTLVMELGRVVALQREGRLYQRRN